VFAKQWGVDGVAWAIPISTLLTSAWGYPLMISRCIRMKQAAAAAAANGAGAAATATTAVTPPPPPTTTTPDAGATPAGS